MFLTLKNNKKYSKTKSVFTWLWEYIDGWYRKQKYLIELAVSHSSDD